VPQLSETETRDTGQVIAQTRKQLVPRAADNFHYFAEMCVRVDGHTYPTPTHRPACPRRGGVQAEDRADSPDGVAKPIRPAPPGAWMTAHRPGRPRIFPGQWTWLAGPDEPCASEGRRREGELHEAVGAPNFLGVVEPGTRVPIVDGARPVGGGAEEAVPEGVSADAGLGHDTDTGDRERPWKLSSGKRRQ
jgi:hypothetical protein